jgi:probable HAF family extracellular repeat protein
MSTLAGSVIARPTLFALLVAVLAHPAGAAPPAYTAVETQVAVGLSPLADTGLPPALHAVLWQGTSKTTATDLGVLPGAFPEPGSGPDSEAHGLNAVGDVVGCSASGFPTYHPGFPYESTQAFLWNSGVMHDLGTLANELYDSCANAVNDSHEVVGWSNAIANADGSVLQRAFVYIAGTMYDLSFYLTNASTIRLTNALSIDCQGDIAAIGYDLNTGPTHTHTYLLNRVGPRRTCPQ